MNNVSFPDSFGHPLSEKKDCYDSANTDSGFLSGHNLNTSENIASSESFSFARNNQSSPVDLAPSSDEKQIGETHSNVDSGMIPDAELDSRDSCLMDICERFDRLMKRDWMKYYQQDEIGDTQLHRAAYEGNDEDIIRLVANVPRQYLNIQNDAAQTGLHLAVLADHSKIVRRLLAAGINRTIRDKDGNTALHLACLLGNSSVVKELLISHDTLQGDASMHSLQDLELWNYDGKTCVHLAAEAGSIEILRSLIDAGADINAREGKSGLCPLHISIEHGNEELANFLLDECPRVSLETMTYAGLTAYQLALSQDKQILVSDLTKHGAAQISPPESDVESDSEDEMIGNYYGTNAFTPTFPGLSAINVS